jgi:TniQ
MPEGFILCAPAPLFQSVDPEGYLGYLRRLADENNYAGIGTILSALGTKHLARGGLFSSFEQVSRLADLTDQAASLLLSIAHPAAGRGRNGTEVVLFRGNAIPKLAISTVRVKVCPECLAQGTPYRRAVWDLKLLMVCPVHGSWLIWRCPACHRSLSWTNTRVVECTCDRKVDLRRAPRRSCAAAVADLNYILAELALNRVPRECGKMPQELADMGLDDLLSIIARVGGLASTGRFRSHYAICGADRAADIVRAAASVLADWPKRFVELVKDRFEAVERRAGKKRAREHLYGAALEAIVHEKRPSAADRFLLRALREHDLSAFDSSPRRLLTVTCSSRQRRWYSASETCIRLHCDRATIGKLARSGRLEVRMERRRHRRFTWCDAVDVRRLERELKRDRAGGFHTIVSAAAELKVDHGTVTEMVSEGILPFLGYRVHCPSSPLIPRNAPRALIRRINNTIVEGDPTRVRMAVLARGRRIGVTRVEALKLVLAGKIRPLGWRRGKRVISQLLFDAKDLMASGREQ